jgi:hypothetical protein
MADYEETKNMTTKFGGYQFTESFEYEQHYLQMIMKDEGVLAFPDYDLFASSEFITWTQKGYHDKKYFFESRRYDHVIKGLYLA